MADVAGTSTAPAEKPVIVRVKRKLYQSPLDAFWLEINDGPLKKQLLNFEKLSVSESPAKVSLDFEKLSITESSSRIEELKIKKVFVQHVETVSSSKGTIDVLKSFLPKPDGEFGLKTTGKKRKHVFKNENIQYQQLSKARQKQELLAKSARFKQIWKSRKGNDEDMDGIALNEICHLYDVVRVDEETSKQVQEQEDMSPEDHKLMCNYLPLIRECVPSAVADIECDIHGYLSKQGLASSEDFVYDLYTVNNDIKVANEDTLKPFPLVQVDDDDTCYVGPYESDFDTDDSNAEDNPLNEYPDEESEDEDDAVLVTDDEDESSSLSSSSKDPDEFVIRIGSDNGDPTAEDEISYVDDDDVYSSDDDPEYW